MSTALTPFEHKIVEVVNQLTSGVENPEQWLVDMLGGATTSSGVQMSPRKALSLPAVWNSVFRIAGHVGMLPKEIRRPLGGTTTTSTIMPGHPAGTVLNGPNERQTGQIFCETLQTHALLEGNGRAVIIRNNVGQPVELILIPPEHVYSMMWEGEKWHIIHLPLHYLPPEYQQASSFPMGDGPPSHAQYRIHDRDIFHIPGLGWNGLWGISLVGLAKDTFGLDAAGLDAAGYSFANNGRPGLLLEAPPNQLTKAKDAQEFIDNFNEMHQGLDNAGKTGLIRAGMKAHVLPTSAVDAQHIENRKFSRQDIALLFGTESVMGEGAAVYKDRQDRMIAYVQNCLKRWFQRWNHEAQRKLFSSRDRAAGVFLQFDATELIADDPNSLADYTGKLYQQNALTENEIRAMHHKNPLPGGDTPPWERQAVRMPAIEGPPETDEEEETEEPEASNRIARVAVNRVFRDLISEEMRRVKAASKKPAEFNDKLQKFYFHFRDSLSVACEDCELPKTLAHQHCDRSILTLTEIAGVCAGDLSGDVAATVADWKKRAETFSNAI